MAMNPASEIAPPMGGGHGAQCRRSPSPRLSALLLLAMLPLRSCTFTVPTMVVGGNFTLGGRPSNLAQYDPKLKLWIDQFEPDLYVYGATSGAVSDIATNRSADGSGFDELYVVGAFDTICSTCQAQTRAPTLRTWRKTLRKMTGHRSEGSEIFTVLLFRKIAFRK